MPDSATRSERLRAAHDKLQGAVAAIVSGDDWKRMLKVASNFHRYSFNNHLMIFCQRPDATLVAGFQKWKTMNRRSAGGGRLGSLESRRFPEGRRERLWRTCPGRRRSSPCRLPDSSLIRLNYAPTGVSVGFTFRQPFARWVSSCTRWPTFTARSNRS